MKYAAQGVSVREPDDYLPAGDGPAGNAFSFRQFGSAEDRGCDRCAIVDNAGNQVGFACTAPSSAAAVARAVAVAANCVDNRFSGVHGQLDSGRLDPHNPFGRPFCSHLLISVDFGVAAPNGYRAPD
jgi:hypothetical protein